MEVCFSTDASGRARLTITHTARVSEHWDEFGAGAVCWELALIRFGLHLAQRDNPKLDEAVFATTPVGKALISGSSEAWDKAAVAAGTELDAATRRQSLPLHSTHVNPPSLHDSRAISQE